MQGSTVRKSTSRASASARLGAAGRGDATGAMEPIGTTVANGPDGDSGIRFRIAGVRDVPLDWPYSTDELWGRAGANITWRAEGPDAGRIAAGDVRVSTG